MWGKTNPPYQNKEPTFRRNLLQASKGTGVEQIAGGKIRQEVRAVKERGNF